MKLSGVDCENLRNAIYHLIECWDCLRRVETSHASRIEIETADIEYLASSCGPSSDALALNRKALQTLFEPESERKLQ